MNRLSIVSLGLLLAPWICIHGEQEMRRSAQASFAHTVPQIDGQLDEAEWGEFSDEGDFIQSTPRVGETMTEPTEFRILYTEQSLYIGIRCYDSEPNKIIARETRRDGNLSKDDNIYFIIDTYLDRRNAFAFSVNPLGAQWDALVSQNSSPDSNWDGIWHASCQIDEQGWTAEIAIPIDSLDFDEAITTWGFNIQRSILRKAEQGRWTRPEPDLKIFQPSEAGDITGLVGFKQQTRFEFRPYASVRVRDADGKTSTTGDIGGDLRYRITPSLSATLSINMDFAETAVDTPQINFTRFPLFFPEKREFFLEDRAFYNFAQPFSKHFIPYHTRRIGLSPQRDVVPILGALKVAGKSGPYQIGFTGAYLDEFGAVDQQPVFAARVSRNIGTKSKIGLITTIGDPDSEGDNTGFGIDYQYRTTELWSDRNFELNTFAYHSNTNPTTDSSFSDEAFGISLNFPNEPIGGSVKVIELGDELDPRMGYVRRTGIRRYSSHIEYIFRPEEITWFNLNRIAYSNSMVTNLDNHLESYSHSFFPINLAFSSNNYISLGVNYYYDSFDFDWFIAEDFRIPAGEYDNYDISLSIGSAPERTLSADLTLSHGDYYGGQQSIITPNVTWHPAQFLQINLYHYYSRITRGSESLDSHISSNQLLLKFSPTLNWSNTLQYDNQSDNAGWNSRLIWEYQPGSRFYVVFNQGYLIDGGSAKVEESQLTIKGGINIRF